jgi:predicted pyridoxine 5'-phosphate oxidase superfamily flavin-nucleotide-binding protein
MQSTPTGQALADSAPPKPPHPTGIAPDDVLELQFCEQADGSAPADAAPDDPWPEAATTLPGSRGEHLLQRAYGSDGRAGRFYADQHSEELNEAMVEFIGRAELAFVATADAAGAADCSLRAGPPGFIRVLDQTTVAYPEYRGNGVLASLGNISENPQVGLLLVDFVRDVIGLHVNGDAGIVEDAELRARHPELPCSGQRGRRPERWVVVSVVEAYVHCRKHIPRMVPADAEHPKPKGGGDYFGVRRERRLTKQPQL